MGGGGWLESVGQAALMWRLVLSELRQPQLVHSSSRAGAAGWGHKNCDRDPQDRSEARLVPARPLQLTGN